MQQAGEKDQLSDRVKADTVKALLAVVDSFEMAKGTLKPDSEAEKKIDSAYQVRLSPHNTTDCTPSAACNYLSTLWPHALSKARVQL